MTPSPPSERPDYPWRHLTYDDPPPDLAWFDPREWIAGEEWRYAKSMPKHPHWYVMAHFANDVPGVVKMLHVIHREGVLQRWGRQTYRYLTIDGYDYWGHLSTENPPGWPNRRVTR